MAGRRRIRQVEAATATAALNKLATSLLRGPPIPLLWALGVGPVLAAWTGCSVAALADGPGLSQAAPQSEISCQDQFMIDRRDAPSEALKHFQRCNAVRDLVGNMEYFTFRYVTLPPALHHKQDGTFEKAWKNNLGLLTGRVVSFSREQAIKVLDDSIVRGLRRGKREDLIATWLGGHDPEYLALNPPGSAPAQATPAHSPEPAVAAPSVTRTAVSTPQPEAAKPAPPHAAETPRRTTRRSQSRPARVYRDADEYAADREAQILNRTYLETGRYAAAPVPYPAQPYYAVAPNPAAYSSPPTTTYAAPSAVAPVAQPSPLARPPSPPPPVAADIPQSLSVASSPTYAQAIPFPPQVTLIGQQIDTNVRTISGLIEGNFRTFEKLLLGTGTPPAQP